ncbi:hypothetical protein RU50_001307 [Salmonella enterica subsp. enterica]|nr:hypothetical protein [Salmonella enterica subsp. enterica]
MLAITRMRAEMKALEYKIALLEESESTRKPIQDTMGVYSAHPGKSAKKPYATARIVNIHIRNDVIGDRRFSPTIAETLANYAEMIKSGGAGHGSEYFEDDNGNKLTITCGTITTEQEVPYFPPRF